MNSRHNHNSDSGRTVFCIDTRPRLNQSNCVKWSVQFWLAPDEPVDNIDLWQQGMETT